MSYVCTQRPRKSRVFAPIFDDFACSYKNEGSIPFTRSNNFLSIFAVFPVTVIRVSYDTAPTGPVSAVFTAGIGLKDSTDRVVNSGLLSIRPSSIHEAPMAPTPLHRIVAIGLLATVVLGHAAPTEWSPFTSPRSPRRVKWSEWVLEKPTRGTTNEVAARIDWRFRPKTGAGSTAAVTRSGKGWILSVQGAGGTHQSVVPDPTEYAEVQLASAELNGDGRDDYILRYDPHGCGLAGIGQTITLVLSGKDGHRSHELYQLGFDTDSLVQFKPNGPWHWVVTEMVGVPSGESTDGRNHSFWVYRLFRIERDSLKGEPDGFEGFPKWIQYLHRPNHKETNLLPTSQKRAHEKKLLPPTPVN